MKGVRNGEKKFLIQVVVKKENFVEFVNFLQKHRVSVNKIFAATMDESENWLGVLIEDEPGRIAQFDKQEILKLRRKKLTYREIAEKVGCSKSYVEKVCREILPPKKFFNPSAKKKNNNKISVVNDCRRQPRSGANASLTTKKF